jgi:hypothetical protein
MSDSTKAIRAVRGIPPEVYRLPTDGRKWLHDCQLRKYVVLQLATYADANGSRIFPSARTIGRELGISERTVKYVFNDLKTLGVLIDQGFTDGKYKHTRIRALDIAKIRHTLVQDSPETVVQDSQNARARFADTVVQDSQNGRAGFANSKRESCTQPSLEETDRERTDHPEPSSQPAKRAGRQVVDPVSPQEKREWLEFIKLLPEEMRCAHPTPDEMNALLGQLAEIGDGETLADAIDNWVDMQSPPISTLRYGRWKRWLETGVKDFEEAKNYAETFLKKEPVTRM